MCNRSNYNIIICFNFNIESVSFYFKKIFNNNNFVIIKRNSFYIFIFLYSFIDYFRIFCSVKKNGIVIIKDNVKTTQSAQNPIDNPFFRSTYTYFLQKPYVIEFNKYGKYKIPRGYNYKFCLNKMLDKNIYESTSLGDEFYLAVTKENKIATVYNTKFFYYAEK